MNAKLMRLCFLCVMLLTTSIVLAQSADPTIPRWTPSAAGGTIKGGVTVGNPALDGEYELTVTFGHPFTGNLLGGGYSLTTGYWQTPQTDRVLAIFALALDNNPVSTINLSAYHRETIQAIVDATKLDDKKIAIVLSDLTGDGNTRLLKIVGGTVRPVVGLPEEDGTFNAAKREYDMTNGQLLGQVIKWAKKTYPADSVYFAYIGHGVPLAPKTNVAAIFPEVGTTSNQTKAATAGALAVPDDVFPPLPPTRKLSHPEITDFHDKALISPYDLQQALDVATDGGRNPLTAVDITHCFAASIEELYELSNPQGNPYAQVLIGSPNYTYFSPEYMKRTLIAMKPEQNARELANVVIRSYSEVLLEADASIDDPTIGGHPHILVAVDSNQIPPIKDTIDEISSLLLQPENYDEIKITEAYSTSLKYDTTYCSPQDWTLKPPDALSDLADFMSKLASEIPAIRDLTTITLTNQIATSIITSTAASGQPWFAEVKPKPLWDLSGSGLAIYTDFQGVKKRDQITNTLSWHAYWYTDTIRLDDVYPNEHPYMFIQSEESPTWANLFYRLWRNKTVAAEFCLPQFPPVVRKGELSFDLNDPIVFPLDDPGMLSAKSPSPIAVAISTTQSAPNVTVQFTVTHASGVVFTDTVGAGDMITGTHLIETSRPFSTSLTGWVTIDVEIDPENRFDEEDESNSFDQRFFVVGEFDRPAISATLPSQWVTTDKITVSVQQDQNTDEIEDIRVNVYQYNSDDNSPDRQVATKVEPLKIDSDLIRDLSGLTMTQSIPIMLTLWPLQPGPVEMHLWGLRGTNPTRFPAIVKFNYVPPSLPIDPGERQYYLFDAEVDDDIELTLNIEDDRNTDANLYVWHPDTNWGVEEGGIGLGDNKIKFLARSPGKYVVSVEGTTAAKYTLIASQTRGTESDVPSIQAANFDAYLNEYVSIPSSRPIFISPIPQRPLVPPEFRVTYLPIVMQNYSSPLPDLVIKSLTATDTNVQIVIANQGHYTVTSDFWVDAYVDPSPVPTKPNQIWPGLSFQGMVWAVTEPALPLAPGETITLRINDPYYTSTLSVFTPTLPIGTPIYAQVDSANIDTNYGAVFESDERGGGINYNNIISTTVSVDASIPASQGILSVDTVELNRREPQLPVRPSIGILPEVNPDRSVPALDNQTVLTHTILLPLIQD